MFWVEKARKSDLSGRFSSVFFGTCLHGDEPFRRMKKLLYYVQIVYPSSGVVFVCVV